MYVILVDAIFWKCHASSCTSVYKGKLRVSRYTGYTEKLQMFNKKACRMLTVIVCVTETQAYTNAIVYAILVHYLNSVLRLRKHCKSIASETCMSMLHLFSSPL